jgi:uncharacterized repeat protein (TIGR01451 family)
LSYVDGDGCLFFAERSGHRVRMICEPGNGMVDGHSPDQLVQTVAGTGVAGFNGDDIDPLTAQLSFPSGVAEAENGLLLIADAGNLRVRAVDPFRIYTVAGGGSNASDDIEATLAAFGTNVLSAFDPADSLGGVTVARDGNNEVLYIADKANHRVRVVCLVCEPVFDGPPDLVISKAIQVSGQRLDQLDVQNGETVQFVIRVENVGGGPTTLPVTVTDTLHSALEVTGAPSSCTWFGQVVSCDIGRVGVSSADRVVELVLTVRVSPRAAGPGETSEIQNVASVFTGDDDDPGNNTSNSVTLVVHGPRSPELQIFKSIAGEPDPRIVVGNGASITFLLSVSNSGGPTTGPVTVTDTLDPRLSFVSGTDCSAQNTPGGQVVSCEIASLDDSHSHTFEVVTQVSATAAAVGETVEFVNVASVATPDEGFPADNTSPPVTVVVRGAAPPSVAVVQSIAGQADPWITVNNGAVVTFELAAGNSGGATTGPVTVTDTLDPRLRFVSGADCSAQDTPSGQVVTCQIAGLASGEIHSTLHTFAIATQVSPRSSTSSTSPPSPPRATSRGTTRRIRSRWSCTVPPRRHRSSRLHRRRPLLRRRRAAHGQMCQWPCTHSCTVPLRLTFRAWRRWFVWS